MMRLTTLLITCFVFTFSFAGCSTTMSAPVLNSVDIKKTDFYRTFKFGESCQSYALGFIGPFGNASIIDAAKKGEISKVELVDHQYNHYILFSQNCVKVHGT